MPTRNVITVKGVRYPSVRAAALAFGADPEQVRHRVRRGWSIARALTEPVGKPGGPTRAVAVRYRGRHFPSIEQAARELGVSSARLSELRQRGTPLVKAIDELLVREKERSRLEKGREAYRAKVRRSGAAGARPFIVRGVRYANLIQLAHAFGVDKATLRHRLRGGWTLEQAVGVAPRPKLVRTRRPVFVAGLNFPNIMAAAKHYGVEWSIARYRLEAGHTPEQAFGVEPFVPLASPQGKETVVAGRKFGSFSAACKAFGKSPSVMAGLRRQGWTVEQAFGLEPVPRKHEAVVIHGEPYRFISHAARAHQVDPLVLRRLLKCGISPEEAVRRAQEQWARIRAADHRVGKRLDEDGVRVTARRPVTVKGIRYPSVRAAARAFGVNPGRVKDRVRRGWSVERALTEPVASATKPVGLRYRGRSYQSISEALRELQLNAQSFKCLRERGVKIKDAFDELLAREKARPQLLERRAAYAAKVRQSLISLGETFEIQGRRYTSCAHIERAFGVSRVTFRGRLRLGWTLEQAVGLASPPKLVRNRRPLTVAGRTFPNLMAAVRHYKVDWSVARYRLHVGATPEQALGLEPFTPRTVLANAEPVVIGGMTFRSLNEACRKLEKTRSVIEQRLKRGERLEQAFDLQLPPASSAAVVIEGLPFRTVAQAARHHKVDYATLARLLRSGVTAEEAVRRCREWAARGEPEGRTENSRSSYAA